MIMVGMPGGNTELISARDGKKSLSTHEYQPQRAIA